MWDMSWAKWSYGKIFCPYFGFPFSIIPQSVITYVWIVLLSKAQVDEAWESSNKVVLFRILGNTGQKSRQNFTWFTRLIPSSHVVCRNIDNYAVNAILITGVRVICYALTMTFAIKSNSVRLRDTFLSPLSFVRDISSCCLSCFSSAFWTDPSGITDETGCVIVTLWTTSILGRPSIVCRIYGFIILPLVGVMWSLYWTPTNLTFFTACVAQVLNVDSQWGGIIRPCDWPAKTSKDWILYWGGGGLSQSFRVNLIFVPISPNFVLS
jgi:hypothetical protein